MSGARGAGNGDEELGCRTACLIFPLASGRFHVSLRHALISRLGRGPLQGCSSKGLLLAHRMESDEDSDSPDSIVPASSPESILGEEAPRFPQLGSGRWEQEERALSPVIPIIPRASIPGRGCSGCGEGQAALSLGAGERGGRSSHTSLSLSVFPESKPYGALDLEAPGKLPATTWEKGKGSEVSVMLTVSAAAAKVYPGGA